MASADSGPFQRSVPSWHGQGGYLRGIKDSSLENTVTSCNGMIPALGLPVKVRDMHCMNVVHECGTLCPRIYWDSRIYPRGTRARARSFLIYLFMETYVYLADFRDNSECFHRIYDAFAELRSLRETTTHPRTRPRKLLVCHSMARLRSSSHIRGIPMDWSRTVYAHSHWE